MQMKKLFAGFGVGVLMLAGVIAANPFDGAAQQEATPPAQASENEDQANATPVVGNPTLQPAIDLIRAQEVALGGQTGAVVVSVDLDGEDGVLAYYVQLDNGTEVEVDATSGTVIKTDQSADEGNGDNGDENGADEGNGDENGGNQNNEDDNGGSQDNGGNGENEDA